jgi:hypothetical protein
MEEGPHVFCPRCGFNNVDSANYCGGCALTLTTGAAPFSPPSPPPPGPAPSPPPGSGPAPFGAPRAGWGQPDPYLPPRPDDASVKPHWSGMAIAGFVISFFCGVLGLVFSIMGYRECKEGQGRVQGEGLAIAGMIISVLVLLYTVHVALR